MASGQVSPKVGKVIDIPANAPTIGTATDLATDGKVSVPFTAGSTTTGGPVFSYKAVSNPGSIVGTGTSSPITVSGLTNDTAYTFIVAGVNATGAGPYSAASNSATPTVPPTSFESIATITAAGGETSLSFTSIAGTYKSLQMRYIGMDNSGGTSAGALKIRLNSDSGANYTEHKLLGQGTAASAGGATGRNELRMDFGVTQSGSTSTFAAGIMDLVDYSSTTKYKTMRGFGGQDKNGTGFIILSSGLWLNTAAITTIQVLPESSAFASGSTFALYGIKG